MIKGPELLPGNGLPAKKLMIMLHGLGANGEDLLTLAPSFRKIFPEMHFVAPNAPFAYDGSPFGNQWFGFRDQNEESLFEGLEHAKPYLDNFIDSKLRELNLQERDLVVLGFSQGTMMALHTILRRPTAASLILGFSGMLVAPDKIPQPLKGEPKVALLHGAQDDIVLVHHAKLASNTLKALGLDVECIIYENLGHHINQKGIDDAIAMIKKEFAR